MTTSDRNALIQSYGQAYHTLTEAIERYPREMWQWKPAPEKWSICLLYTSDAADE